MQIRPKIDDESPAWRRMERGAVTLSQRINKTIMRSLRIPYSPAPILLAVSRFQNWQEPRMRTIIIGTAIATFGAVPALATGSATAGKDVYDRACKTCHGPTGEANPGIVKMMKVEIENLGSHDVQSLGDEDLKKIVTDGKGKMKPIHFVTGKSVDDVIAYIRTLKK
jgi:mono/diheme cytochrome c family protein